MKLTTSFGILSIALIGCASPSTPQTTSSSNWLTCKTLNDCPADSNAVGCQGGYCVDATGQRLMKSDGGTGTGGAINRGTGGASGAGTGGQGGALVDSGPGLPAYCSVFGTAYLDASTIESLVGDAAASCTIQASKYDRSCKVDADCVLVGVGNACAQPCDVKCANFPVNRSAVAQNQADLAKTPLAACSNVICGCDCIGEPTCRGGICEETSCTGGVVDSGAR